MRGLDDLFVISLKKLWNRPRFQTSYLTLMCRLDVGTTAGAEYILRSKCYSKCYSTHNWYVSPCYAENVATYNYLGWKCYIATYFVMVVLMAFFRHWYLWYCISYTLRYSVWVHLEILNNNKNIRVGNVSVLQMIYRLLNRSTKSSLTDCQILVETPSVVLVVSKLLMITLKAIMRTLSKISLGSCICLYIFINHSHHRKTYG